jgi:hypothetical protein
LKFLRLSIIKYKYSGRKRVNVMLKDNILDVAIVGGGVSGVYSAWRLMTSQTQKSERLEQMLSKRGEDRLKIAVFEGSHRIGGRLLSVTPPGMPNTRCELGGMRYMSCPKKCRTRDRSKQFYWFCPRTAYARN